VGPITRMTISRGQNSSPRTTIIHGLREYLSITQALTSSTDRTNKYCIIHALCPFHLDYAQKMRSRDNLEPIYDIYFGSTSEYAYTLL
jgi:hypothetical protein